MTGLTPFELGADPYKAFGQWMARARAESRQRNPNAMALATVSASGAPSVRMVLLKDFSPQGFVFFTNFESRKGQELEGNPQAALVFYWDALSRQVRVEGKVEKLPRNQAEVYFHSRARGSQSGAWASNQSREISSHEELVARAAEIEKKYEGEEIPMPPYWGGFCLKPVAIEFWQERPNRLHDRIVYVADGRGGWSTKRLSP